MTLEEFQKLSKKSKFRSIRTKYKDRTYDSKLEQKRAIELDHLISLSLVYFWLAQPCFELVEGFSYKPDFLVLAYIKSVGLELEVHAEDVKGKETQRFRDAKKLWIAHAPIPLHVLKANGKGWRTEIVRPKGLK